MDGPTHYLMAEKLLRGARSEPGVDSDYLVAVAQVHATLALAAATAEAYGQDRPGGPDWREALK